MSCYDSMMTSYEANVTLTANQTWTYDVEIDDVAPLHESSISCRFYYDDLIDPAPGRYEAKNVPQYSYEYNSTRIEYQCEYL